MSKMMTGNALRHPEEESQREISGDLGLIQAAHRRLVAVAVVIAVQVAVVSVDPSLHLLSEKAEMASVNRNNS